MSISVAWLEGAAAREALATDIRPSDAAGPHAAIFDSRAWIEAAARHLVSAGREIVVLTVRNAGRVVGRLPLTRGREFLWGMPARTLRALGHPLSDRLTLPFAQHEPACLEAALDSLSDPRVAKADVAILSELPRNEGLGTAIERWSCRRGRPVLMRHCSRAPLLDVSRPEALRASYSKGLRTRLSRARKRLKAVAPVTFERRLPRPDEVGPLLDVIAAVERESWKGKAGTGIFSTEPSRRFFAELSRELAAVGRLEINLLRLGDEVATYRYGFRVARRYYDYNFAYPVRHEALSVGRVLLDDVILSAAESGIDIVDSSRGSLSTGNILKDWTDDFIDHDELWLFAASAWGECLSLTLRKAKPAAKRLMARLEAA